jgi:hypothetical protein
MVEMFLIDRTDEGVVCQTKLTALGKFALLGVNRTIAHKYSR